MRTLTVEVYSCCAPRLFLCCSGRPASEHPPGSLGSRSQQGGERGGLFVGEVKVHRRDMGLRSAALQPAPTSPPLPPPDRDHRLPPPPAPTASQPVLQIEHLRTPVPAEPDDEGPPASAARRGRRPRTSPSGGHLARDPRSAPDKGAASSCLVFLYCFIRAHPRLRQPHSRPPDASLLGPPEPLPDAARPVSAWRQVLRGTLHVRIRGRPHVYHAKVDCNGATLI